MRKMTIPAFITFLFFVSISQPVKIVEIEKEVLVLDTIVEYRSVYDWQIHRRHELKNEKVIRNMDMVANKILTPIQQYANKYRGEETNINPISFCRDWNKGSQHTKGKAVDIDLEGKYAEFGNKAIYEFIKKNLIFDQLIIYTSLENPTSIHVSYDIDRNRQEIKLATKKRGKRMKYKLIE